MARSRNLKPGFFHNEILADCEPLARILFAGLWTIADREGRLECRPRKIKIECLPYDECDVVGLLRQLHEKGFVISYKTEEGNYLQITNFVKHQNPHHMEVPSVIPPPPGCENKFNHTPISPKQRARIYARDKHECVLCGNKENLQIDHIVLVSQGGTSDDLNLRTLCSQCNNKRSKRPLNSLLPLTSYLNPLPDSLNPLPSSKEIDRSSGREIAPSRKKSAAGAFVIPHDWEPDLGYAEKLGLVNGTAILESKKFMAYWTEGKGQGKRRSEKGWRQTWFNWVQRAVENPRGNQAPPREGPATQLMRAAKEVVDERQRERERKDDGGRNASVPLLGRD